MEIEVRLVEFASSNEVKHQCNDTADDPDVAVHYVLYVHKSRVLWLGLYPLLWEAPNCACAVLHIMDHCFPDSLYGVPIIDRSLPYHHVGLGLVSNRTESRIRSRRFTFGAPLHWIPSSTDSRSLPKGDGLIQNRTRRVILWICPPVSTYFEYTWTRRLLRWERMYIQAQSISGYIATLGGGFFLCHHFRTAIVLAKYQQQLAVLLNDLTMYYTCYVNMAYSYIYNGYFRRARSILRQVLNELTTTKMDSKEDGVVRMCHSAQLFCRRMRASRNIQASSILTAMVDPDSNQQKQIVPIDNFRRIRVVTDKSKQEDLVIPFTRTSR